MGDRVDHFSKWHKTRAGYAVMGVLELLIAYLIGSRGINTGSWWEYLFTLIFLIGGAQNIVKLIQDVVRRK